jgi:1A family penicillin-binding protein
MDVYRQRLDALATHDFFQSIEIVDRDGRHLATVAPEGQRIWIGLSDIPQTVRDAIIATEDQTFYSNTGVDPSALARAALQNAQAGEAVSGASTITMQLVRLVAFDQQERYEQSLERKLREANLAADVDEAYSKDEILEAYLNVAYFGHQAYGVEAAARVYFGRSARQLSLSQATMLAGLPQAPAVLDPIENPDRARARQKVVLDRMVAVGSLSAETADAAFSEPLELAPQENVPRKAPYFVDYVLEQLPDLVGADVAARGGFTVTTTLDLALDEKLAEIAKSHVEAIREQHDVSDAAAVILRPGSGEILAMTGGVDYDRPGDGQVNVVLRRRQPGSAFKPIVYSAALENGYSPASLLWDIPYAYPNGGNAYTPTNYDDRYRGPVRLRQALANSLNAATVGLAADLGINTVFDMAKRAGLNLKGDPGDYGLSIALGGAEVRLLDLTAAYAAFAAGGTYAAPRPILAVESFGGGKLLHVPATQEHRLVDADTAFLISSILSDVEARRPAFGEGGPLRTSKPTAVKTGTSNDFRDNLTIGYTPYLAVGVWAGNKDGSPMRDVLGITGAAPIWHDAMETVFGDPGLLTEIGEGTALVDDFTAPPTVRRQSTCDLTTLGVDGGCHAFDEYFAADATDPLRTDAFAWLRVRAAKAGGLCSEQLPYGTQGGQAYLTAPSDTNVAGQVRSWAAARGIQVAPPLCPDRAAALPGTSPRP